MARLAQNVVLSPSRDIPFNKLVLSQSNVRRIKEGISIQELAEDIARRVRNPGRRPSLPGAVAFGEAEAVGEDRPDALHRAGGRVRHPAPMTDEQSALNASLLAEYRALEEEYSGQDEYPEEIDARLGQLEMAMEVLEQRPLIYDPPRLRARASS